MEALLNALAAWPGARWLQGSGTAYLLVNAAHMVGLALLVGAVMVLDIALLRRTPRAALQVLCQWLPRAAAYGLALALLTGLWLLSVRPHDYVGNTAFLTKLGLLALALLNIAWQHASADWPAVLNGNPPSRALQARAVLSILLWLAVVVAGRWIGFL